MLISRQVASFFPPSSHHIDIDDNLTLSMNDKKAKNTNKTCPNLNGGNHIQDIYKKKFKPAACTEMRRACYLPDDEHATARMSQCQVTWILGRVCEEWNRVPEWDDKETIFFLENEDTTCYSPSLVRISIIMINEKEECMLGNKTFKQGVLIQVF